MARFLVRRLFLSLITLCLLATIVFVIANVLPNDVGRTILGPFAPQESVTALNHRLGTDRPLLVRYVDSMIGIVTLNFGDSNVTSQPVLPQLAGAIGRSAKLAGLALLIGDKETKAAFDEASSPEEVLEEIAVTVVHEVAHHFGITDERLHELGWE